MIDEQNLPEETSCGACVYKIVDNEAFIALIHPTRSRTWGFPKGHVDKGEDLSTTAKREVLEEAGIEICLHEKLNTVTTRSSQFPGGLKQVHIWLATQVGTNELIADDPDGEVGDVRWFNIMNLPEVHFYQRPVLHEALALIHSRLSNSYR